MIYNLDDPVWAFIIINTNGKVTGISVPTHQIDHMTLLPLEE